MNKSKRLVFFGTDDFSAESLRTLINEGYSIIAVVTKPDSRRGRSKELVQPEVKKIALEHDIPVYQPTKVGDIEHELRELNPTAGVLVSFGKLLPKRILDVFEPIGIINVHPSLLPRYRGPSPITAVIVAGDIQTGISIMRLSEGMDDGPVYSTSVVPLSGTETRSILKNKLAIEGARHLKEVLPSILSGDLTAKSQSNDGVTYTTIITKHDGVLNPLTETAIDIERKVRAYQDYPKTRLNLSGNDVIVTSAKVVDSPDKSRLIVECANNSYLEIVELTAPSGKTMSGLSYMRGYSV